MAQAEARGTRETSQTPGGAALPSPRGPQDDGWLCGRPGPPPQRRRVPRGRVRTPPQALRLLPRHPGLPDDRSPHDRCRSGEQPLWKYASFTLRVELKTASRVWLRVLNSLSLPVPLEGLEWPTLN